MTDRLSNIELLIMLSEDVRSQGDEVADEIHQRGTAHAQRVNELISMLDKARKLLEQERQRFAPYLPSRREPQDVIAGAKTLSQLKDNPAPDFLKAKTV